MRYISFWILVAAVFVFSFQAFAGMGLNNGKIMAWFPYNVAGGGAGPFYTVEAATDLYAAEDGTSNYIPESGR